MCDRPLRAASETTVCGLCPTKVGRDGRWASMSQAGEDGMLCVRFGRAGSRVDSRRAGGVRARSCGREGDPDALLLPTDARSKRSGECRCLFFERRKARDWEAIWQQSDSPTPQDERRDVASAVTRWLGNPVDPAGSICFIQGLSHACLSMNHTDGETANGSLQHLSSTRRHGPCVRYGYLMLTVELIRARTAFRGRHLLDSAQRMG